MLGNPNAKLSCSTDSNRKIVGAGTCDCMYSLNLYMFDLEQNFYFALKKTTFQAIKQTSGDSKNI